MAPDSSTPKIEQIPTTPNVPSRSKFRVRFRKAGDLRLVSHHDLMHVVERMFRRADIILSTTQGFHPRPKMAFALSLALGVAGLNEVLEFEVAEPIAAEEIERRMTRQCPPGLQIVHVRTIDPKASAQVRRAWYRFALLPFTAEDLSLRCQAFLDQTEYWIERTRPHARRVNLRPFVSELRIKDDCLEFANWITPNGAARPEEIITALGLGALLDAGAVIERTDLELYDELPPGSEGPPPIQAAIEGKHTSDREPPTASRPTAMIDNPLSFNT